MGKIAKAPGALGGFESFETVYNMDCYEMLVYPIQMGMPLRLEWLNLQVCGITQDDQL